MTAEHDRPTGQARLHAALDAVANTHPVADVWTTIRDRVNDTDGTNTLTPLTPTHGPGRSTRRWFAAAAVLALTAGTTAFALAGRDDDSITTRAGDPLTSTTVGTSTSLTPEATTTTSIPGDDSDPYDRLAATISAEVAPKSVQVAAGEPFTIAIHLTNPTNAPINAPICMPSGASWYIASSTTDYENSGRSYQADCTAEWEEVPPGGNVGRGLLTFDFLTRTRSGSLDLPPGQYEAVIAIDPFEAPFPREAGGEGGIRVPVLITP